MQHAFILPSRTCTARFATHSETQVRWWPVGGTFTLLGALQCTAVRCCTTHISKHHHLPVCTYLIPRTSQLQPKKMLVPLTDRESRETPPLSHPYRTHCTIPRYRLDTRAAGKYKKSQHNPVCLGAYYILLHRAGETDEEKKDLPRGPCALLVQCLAFVCRVFSTPTVTPLMMLLSSSPMCNRHFIGCMIHRNV